MRTLSNNSSEKFHLQKNLSYLRLSVAMNQGTIHDKEDQDDEFLY